ncbi:MAG: hypothetical protein PHS80_01155, partial [Methanothrix sp.]|nr:hypothetical protein [Methanothrix sp.]
MIRDSLGNAILITFILFLLCVTCEGSTGNSGSLSSPGPLLLPLVTASDGNTSGRAIDASIETASNIMVSAGEISRLGEQEALGTTQTAASHPSFADNINEANVVLGAANEISIQFESNTYNITKDAGGYD